MKSKPVKGSLPRLALLQMVRMIYENKIKFEFKLKSNDFV